MIKDEEALLIASVEPAFGVWRSVVFHSSRATKAAMNSGGNFTLLLH